MPAGLQDVPPALGRLTELVISAAPENPGNADLKAVAASLRFAEMAAEENEHIVMQSVPFENIAQWPSLLDGPLKEIPTQALANERRHQSKLHQFDLALDPPVQHGKASRDALGHQDVDFEPGSFNRAASSASESFLRLVQS
jgi:hypothetical protein